MNAGWSVGQVWDIISFIAPSWLVTLLASLLFALVAAALLPGNPISDSVAFLRIRGLSYYQVGDWVTVVGDQYGCVVAIWPLSTLLLTPTQGHVRLHNSFVVGAPIIVHPSQQATPATVNLLSGAQGDGQVGAGANSLQISNAAVAAGVDEVATPATPPQVLPAVLPDQVTIAQLRQVRPLVKRRALGKRSIKSYR